MEIAYCVQCKVDRKVTDTMGGERHLVLGTCGHVVSKVVAVSRNAFIEVVKEWGIMDILDRLEATILSSTYGNLNDQDQISILRAEIISRTTGEVK